MTSCGSVGGGGKLFNPLAGTSLISNIMLCCTLPRILYTVSLSYFLFCFSYNAYMNSYKVCTLGLGEYVEMLL
jgi:hypothetical protein